ncbi:MAG: endonuclease/exonuclease/phosphatase family protein [Gammaproteobacteria bacterium]|nr:MAG: endonuclease/exonuclease/phosphatase family protein [Gammaproteobacteria bacterium]
MQAPSDYQPRQRWPRLALAAAALLLSTSCASQYVEQLSQVAANSRVYGTGTATGVAACRDSLAAPKAGGAAALDPGNISLFNWNIRKERDRNLRQDLNALSGDKDLVLVQEASLRQDTVNGIDSSKFWSFAPGYQLDGEITGVMTLSRVRPLTQCSFVSMEPLLRTPKATSITEYALASTEQTLVVVNLHAVNFSMGTGAYRQQFGQVREALRDHEGPIILSGDFNTWRRKREQIVAELAAVLGLHALSFGEAADDRRVRTFGHVLDHIYVRGLSALDVSTEVVETSDHNPMSATLTM